MDDIENKTFDEINIGDSAKIVFNHPKMQMKQLDIVPCVLKHME